MCLWMWTVLKMWSPKHSSFLCHLNGWSSAFPQLSSSGAVGSLAVAAWETAWGDTPLHEAGRSGHVAAAELLLSKGAAVDATNDIGRGLNPGSRRQTSSLANLGCFKKMLGSMITSSMLMNDHNAICHIDVNFVNNIYIYIFIEFYRHRFVEGNLSETRCIETCWVCLQIVCEYIFQLITSSTNSIIWRRDDFSSTCKVATLRLLDRISLTSPGS